MTQRIGLWQGGTLVIVEPPPAPSSWETPLLYPAPSGWESWPKVYVPPTGSTKAGYNTQTPRTQWATEPNYPPCQVGPPSSTQRNFVVVMPRPGDKKAHTSYRKGAVYLNGGNNVVFATERPDGSLRRGGFVIEMPRFSPFPTPYPWNGKGAGLGYVHDDVKQTLVLLDDSSVDQNAVVDITGFYLRGRASQSLDAGEGITGGTRRRVNLQRYRCEGIHARCAADESGSSGNDGVGTQPGYVANSGYAQLSSWTHCDPWQVWRDGIGEMRMHDCTFESGFGGIMCPTGASGLSGLKTPAAVMGEVYLSRVNFRPVGETYAELGNGTGNLTGQASSSPLGTETCNARTYMIINGAGGLTATLKRLFCAENTVYMERVGGRGITQMLFPNASGSIDISNYYVGGTEPAAGTTGFDATSDLLDKWVSWTASVVGNAGGRFHQKWNGKWGTDKVTDAATAGRFMIGRPLIVLSDGSKVRRDYAPASRWGSAPDWNEYEE